MIPFFAALYNETSVMNTPIFSKWYAVAINGYELFNCNNVREGYQ
jgi:hypothetical protein